MSTIEKYNQGIRRLDDVTDSQADLLALFPFNSQLPYYGKVSYRLNPVQLNELYLQPVVSDSTGNPVVAMDFVADAFQELRNYILRANHYSKIPKGTTFAPRFIDVKAVAGYSDLDDAYINYMSEVYRAFYEVYILANNRQYSITNFSTFMNQFLEFAKLTGEQTPITKSGYYLNNKASILHTGLALKMSDTGVKSPEAKKQLIADPAFRFFANSAKKFGFLINAEEPTMIVANLHSGGKISIPPRKDQPDLEFLEVTVGMKRYLDKYFLVPEEIFAERYYSIIYNEEHYAFTDFNLIKTYLLQFYNDIYDKSPTLSMAKTCYTAGGLETTSYSIDREGIERSFTGGFPSSFEQKYPDEYWLRVYLTLKAIENKKDINFNKAFRNAFILYKENGLKVALAYINRVTKVMPYTPDPTYLMRVGRISSEVRESPSSGSPITQISAEEAQAITSAFSGPTGGSAGGGMSGY